MAKPTPRQVRSYVTPIGKVRYGDDLFEPPTGEVVAEIVPPSLKLEYVERFHAIVEELTDELMSAGHFDRASCRADAITLLTAASERLQTNERVESPLNYLLMEERQKAAASLGANAPYPQALTFMKG